MFVSGDTIGSTRTILAQWILKRLDTGLPTLRSLNAAERDVLRSEVAELHKHLRNMDRQLDFTEKLIDGARTLASSAICMPAPKLPVEHLSDQEG